MNSHFKLLILKLSKLFKLLQESCLIFTGNCSAFAWRQKRWHMRRLLMLHKHLWRCRHTSYFFFLSMLNPFELNPFCNNYRLWIKCLPCTSNFDWFVFFCVCVFLGLKLRRFILSQLTLFVVPALHEPPHVRLWRLSGIQQSFYSRLSWNLLKCPKYPKTRSLMRKLPALALNCTFNSFTLSKLGHG